MCDTTQKPANICPVIEQHLIRVENRLSAVQMALEMMTVANQTNRKSTKDLLSDCERLQKAAVELHQAMSKYDIDVVFEEAAPEADLYASLSRPQGITPNTSLVNQQPRSKATNHDPWGEVEFVLEGIGQLAKARVERHKKLQAEYSELKTKDWIELLAIKSEKAYKGLQVEIDGQQTTIKTFSEYCKHALGLKNRVVDETLTFLKEFGPDLFTALNSINTRFRDMRKVRKLSADQKQALLQIAQTDDKTKTLAFIDQALQAGE